MDILFGILLALAFAIVTWCVASEGAWGAALTFLCVMFSGLLTMNFFEPLAGLIEDSGGSYVAPYADLIAFAGLFALLVFLGRMAAEQISPTDIRMDSRAYEASRWLFGAAAGYTTMAILLTAVHTSPLPREFIGFRPERQNFFDLCAPDRQWLAFTQRVSEKILTQGRVFDGPTWDVPGTDQKVWPSFAMRYATRREDLASGAIKKPVTGGGVPGSAGDSAGSIGAPSGPGTAPSF